MAFSWLWGDPRGGGDVTVRIHDAGCDTIPSTSSDASSTGPITTLRLHALVLSSASPNYFRPRLDRWAERHQGPHTQTGSTAAEPEDSKQHTAASAASPDTGSSMAAPAPAAVPAADNRPRALALEPASASTGDTAPPQAAQDDEPVLSIACLLDEPHTVPEAVLKHAYTGQLADDYTVLIWMVWRADYLNMKTTVDACLSKLQQLADSKQLSVSDTLLVTQLPDLQTPDTRDSVDTLIRTLLPQHFGDTRKVVTTPELLEQFEELPFSALQQWSQLGSQVTVDHENTRVLLLTAWHDTHHDHEAELSAMVRLDLLSVSFHLQVLPQLSWFRAPPGVHEQHEVLHALLRVLRPTNGQYAEQLCPPGAASRLPAKATAVHTLTFSRKEAAHIWNSKPTAWKHPDSVYFAGVKVLFTVEVNHPQVDYNREESGWDLRVALKPEWPDVLEAQSLTEQLGTPAVGIKDHFASPSRSWPTLEWSSGNILAHSGRFFTICKKPVTNELDLWRLLKDGITVSLSDPV